ncbi:MAG: hypothetical protein AVDCRST_MAG71-2290, partial [uncultured Lysobacter sp.]
EHRTVERARHVGRAGGDAGGLPAGAQPAARRAARARDPDQLADVRDQHQHPDGIRRASRDPAVFLRQPPRAYRGAAAQPRARDRGACGRPHGKRGAVAGCGRGEHALGVGALHAGHLPPQPGAAHVPG